MNQVLLTIIVLFSQICWAQQTTNAQVMPQTQARTQVKKQPSLGNCSPYTDYYIYQCRPFKCQLPIPKYANTSREMQTFGYEKGKCVHRYIMVIRNPSFTPTDFKFVCNLSETGRREMAALFTRFKNGDTGIYSSQDQAAILSQECVLE